MIYRLSCVAVVVFWLVMTSMLVVRSYFSTEDRLPKVKDPETVMDLFVDNPNSSNLNVYRDKEVVGSISITPRVVSGGNTEILLTALGRIKFPGLDEQDVAWRGEVELTPARDVVNFELSVKFGDPRITVGLAFDPKSYEIKYRVEHGKSVLVDSSDEKSKAVRRVKMLLGAWGLDPDALKKKEAKGGSIAQKDPMFAQHGKVEIGGDRQSVYILHIAPMRGKEFRVYFSEAGEILKIASDKDGRVMGYEILSEAFKLEPEKGENRKR